MIGSAAADLAAWVLESEVVNEAAVEGSNGYLVSPDNPIAVKEALGRLISSAELRKDFGGRSRRILKDRFSMAAMVEQTIRFYDRVSRS